MAKTIGRDKGSTTRAPFSADEPAASVAEPSDEDLRDKQDAQDDAAVDEDTTAEPNAAADEGEEHELAVMPARALNRAPSASLIRAPSVPAPLLANPFTRYLAESYLELRKVTAPTPREAWNMTLIVILMAGVVAAILGLADIALIHALAWIVSLGNPGSPAPTH